MMISKVHSEWTTIRSLLVKKPKENINLQLKELTSDTLVAMFPNLSKISHNLLNPATFYCFSRKKFLTHENDQDSSAELGTPSHIMMIAIESPDKFTDEHITEY